MGKKSASQPTGPFVYISVLVGFGLAMWAVKPFWDSAGDDSLRAECTVNLELVASRQASIIPERGRPLACAAWPVDPPGPDGTPWQDIPTCWARLGFEPGVTLHGRYEVEATPTSWTARCTLRIREDVEVWEASSTVTAHRVGG